MRRQLTYFVVLAALIFLTAPTAMAAGCVKLLEFPYWINFPASNFINGNFTLFTDSACQATAGGSLSTGDAGMAYASSFQNAMSRCQANNNQTITTVNNPHADGNIWNCLSINLPDEVGQGDRYVGAVNAPDAATALSLCKNHFTQISANHVRRRDSQSWMCFYIRGGSGGGSGSGAGRMNVCDFHINLPLTDLRLHAFDGMDSGIQFRRLDNCGIGDPAVFEMGFLDAVDIWSSVGSGYSVCFPQLGRIVFLDAATSPRTLMDVDYVFDDGFTCAAMDRAGTMALVEADDTGADTSPDPTKPTRRPGTDDSIEDAIDLEDCTVTPRFNLRLRAAPWGTIRDVVPLDAEVQAKARTENWFNVTYEVTEGWSAAWLADSEGECDWTNSDIEGEDE